MKGKMAKDHNATRRDGEVHQPPRSFEATVRYIDYTLCNPNLLALIYSQFVPVIVTHAGQTTKLIGLRQTNYGG